MEKSAVFVQVLFSILSSGLPCHPTVVVLYIQAHVSIFKLMFLCILKDLLSSFRNHYLNTSRAYSEMVVFPKEAIRQ